MLKNPAPVKGPAVSSSCTLKVIYIPAKKSTPLPSLPLPSSCTLGRLGEFFPLYWQLELCPKYIIFLVFHVSQISEGGLAIGTLSSLGRDLGNLVVDILTLVDEASYNEECRHS